MTPKRNTPILPQNTSLGIADYAFYWQNLLAAVVSLVKKVAAEEVSPRFLKVVTHRKTDGSPFTEADLAAQAALVQGLKAIVDCPVLGEEMSDEEQAHHWQQAQTSALWVIDPIDGTTNFIHGIPHFAVSVALMWQGRSVLGVVYNPVTKELYTAVAGAGAALNGVSLPLAAGAKTLKEAVARIEPKHLPGRLPSRLLAAPPYASQRNLGASTLDWCYLAAGRFDVYLHSGQKFWDYAAGALILQEAGGWLCSLHQDDFWQCDVWQRSVVATLDADLFVLWRSWVADNR